MSSAGSAAGFSNNAGVGGSESKWASLIGFAVMLASIQFSVGSVEMSSKFSVASFAKDQTTLQRAADALRMYLYIALLWTAACCLVLFGAYGWVGAAAGLASNLLVIVWIFASYMHSFKLACSRHSLEMPGIMPWSSVTSGNDETAAAAATS